MRSSQLRFKEPRDDHQLSPKSGAGDSEHSRDRDADSNFEFPPVPTEVATEDDGFGQGSSFVHVDEDAAVAQPGGRDQGSFVELGRQGKEPDSPLEDVEAGPGTVRHRRLKQTVTLVPFS